MQAPSAAAEGTVPVSTRPPPCTILILRSGLTDSSHDLPAIQERRQGTTYTVELLALVPSTVRVMLSCRSSLECPFLIPSSLNLIGRSGIRDGLLVRIVVEVHNAKP